MVALFERGLTKPIMGSRSATRCISAIAPGNRMVSEFNRITSRRSDTDSRAAPFTDRPKPRFRWFSITRQGTQVESSVTACRNRVFSSSSSGESLTAITRQSVAASSAPTRCRDWNRLVTSAGCL